jgi:hypothetical protein
MIEKKFGSIAKEYLIQAFEQFEIQKNEYPDSTFYNVVFNGKEYPPKPIVAIAYHIAFGEKIKTKDFEGGINTPAFKLLNKYGFEIVNKNKTNSILTEQVLVYEIKSSANVNSDVLFSSDRNYFYWNDSAFKKLVLGDIVFVVNTHARKVLYTKLDFIDIPITISGDTTFFTDLDQKFEVSGKWGKFIRLKIISEFDTPQDWKWKSLGSSETTYLNGKSVNASKGENRILNIQQLKQLSSDQEYNSVLDACLLNFSITNDGLIPEIVAAINTKVLQDILNLEEFYFELAVDVFKKFKNFTAQNTNLYIQSQVKYKEEKSFIVFFNSLDKQSEEYSLFELIGKIISYCDLNAADKKRFNEYEDKRTLAKSSVRQNSWVDSLLQYKIDNNSYNNLPSSIKNALIYLENPLLGITMLSENHREKFTNRFLNKDYSVSDNFITDLLDFFEPYNIEVKNKLNYTIALSYILYNVKEVRNLWLDTENNDDIEIISIISLFENITKSAGLKFSEQLIKRFIASLCTKPFVILSGLSGSGKTKIAQSFVEWICKSEKQYKIVPVGADWTNREPLLGYPNGLVADEYITPDSGVIHLLMEAVKEENESKPFFLILDEMNLSHVERYFADFLSIMESNDTIKLYTGAKRKSLDGLEIDLEIGWPKNVFIIGTVNIDETTYMFSPKVLDRANVIEFRISDNEIQTFLNEPAILKLENLKGKGTPLAESFLTIAHSDEIVKNDVVAKELVLFFKHLQPVGAEFGYRSASEIMLLVAKLKLLELKIKTNEALDIAIMQKLLPKLHGSRSKLVKILVALAGLCIEGVTLEEFEKKFDENYKNDFEGFTKKYPISFEKIIRMYKNVLANGFTSYAEA